MSKDLVYIGLPDMREFEKLWKPKWYQSIWYKSVTFVKTGKWPIRVWVMPGADKRDKASAQRFAQQYTRIYKDTLERSTNAI